MRVGLVALLLVLVGASARADDRDVGVVVHGGGSLRAKIEDHLAKRLRKEGYTAVDDPLSKDALNTIANCFIIDDLACARGVVEARAKTPRLVFARIDDSAGAVTLDFTWFSAGHEPVVERTQCAECSDNWQDHTDDLVTKLAAAAEMPIISTADEPPVRPKPRSRFWPTLLISLGAATLVTGGALLYRGLRDGPSHKYVYPQLTPVGITLIAVGGGAVIGGIITW